MPAPSWATRRLQRALGLARTGFPARRAQAVERLPEFEALREEGRAIKDHTLAHLDFYLELYERNVIAAGGHGALGAQRRRGARRRARHLPRGRREDRHQGQVDGRRGDRAQRSPRSERHHAGRDRSRRIHHPAAPRAAEPHHRAGDPPDEGAGRRHLPRRASRARPRPRRSTSRATCATRRAPCCGRNSSPPMSASPAPIS